MQTLVKDIAKLKEFISAEGSTKLPTVSPAITNAERNYIKKVLGTTVYDNLLDGVENDNLTTDEAALLNEVLMALAPLAYYLGTPIQQVRFGDTGLHTSQSNDKERLTKWMYDEFRLQLLIDGHNAIDNLYQYLEATTGADWYADWSGSDSFTTYKTLFVNSAKVFAEHVTIKNCRWLFTLMLPMLGNTEEFFIEPATGKDFFDYLKTKWSADNGSADEKEAIRRLQKCIALMCYAKSLRDPLFVNELVVVTATKVENVKTPDVKAYEALSKEYMEMAESMLNKTIAWFNEEATITTFQTFFESEKYVDPTTVENVTSLDQARPGNKDAKGSFFF